jgi:hypothetical protein
MRGTPCTEHRTCCETLRRQRKRFTYVSLQCVATCGNRVARCSRLVRSGYCTGRAGANSNVCNSSSGAAGVPDTSSQVFYGFPLYLDANAGPVFQIRLRPILSTSFPIHCSLSSNNSTVRPGSASVVK